jgi:predicted esterase YcpF (UPF0227 family)
MKITKAELKRIIKEEVGMVLKEQSLGKIDFEGTETSIEFLGMKTKYDQTEIKLRINGDEYSILGAYDIDSLADEVISEIEDDDEYWFLGEYADEPFASDFKAELKKVLKTIGADPEAEAEARASYNPENVYTELKQIVVEETKKVLLKQRILNEDWNAVLGDSAIINTAIEKLKTIQTGDMKDLLEDNEYLKKFLILLYYVEGYKEVEGEGGFADDLEKYLPPETINRLEFDAKTMAQILEKNLIEDFKNTAGYYPLYTFLSDLGDHTIKTIQDFKAEFEKAGEETTKVAKIKQGEVK